MIQLNFIQKKRRKYILTIFHPLFLATEMEECHFICNLRFVSYIVYASVGQGAKTCFQHAQ